jgi:hypothetical protein
MMLSAWIKIPYTIFVCVLVPVYWVERGPANFLWLSDIALLAIVSALWMENRFQQPVQHRHAVYSTTEKLPAAHNAGYSGGRLINVRSG